MLKGNNEYCQIITNLKLSLLVAGFYHLLPKLSNDDDQPKLRGSGVVVTLVCEYTRDPEGI